MYFTDYNIQKLHRLFEYSNPQQGQFAGNQQLDQDPNQDGQIPVQYEKIKQYILYQRIKNIKQFLIDSDLDKTNSNLNNILEFINIVIHFFNTFTYADVVGLIDMIIETVSNVLKIKLPSILDDLPSEEPQV